MNVTDHSDFEATLRQQLARLADHAPQTIVYPDEVYAPQTTLVAPARRNWLKIGVPLTAALLGTGITAYAATGQNEAGAATPVEAVEMFVAAVEAEDALGVLDIIVPEEAQALKASLDDLEAEATRTGVLNDSMSLSGIAGLSIDVQGETYVTEDLGEGLATVQAESGEWSVTFDRDRLPMGDALRPLVAAATESSFGRDISNSRLTTVRRGGRWFVSPSYTIAEAVRRASTFNVPATIDVSPEGFESPEAAVDAFYQRLAALDVAGLANLAAPGEGDALLRYLPLWLPEIEASIAKIKANGLAFTISGLETSSAGAGRFRTLTPTAFRVEASLPPGTDQGVTFDPALATILMNDAGEMWLIPAGEQIPASVAGLDPTEFIGDVGQTNVVAVLADGAVVQPPSPDGVSSSAQTLAMERRDGCTTLSGTSISQETGSFAFYGTLGERSDDGLSVRVCGRSGPSALGALGPLLLGRGALSDLPAITVVERGGKWYVSPIGTVAGQFVALLRGSDKPLGVDGPLSNLLFGGNRVFADEVLSQVTAVPEECTGFVDTTATPARLLDDPPVAGLRACMVALMNGSFTRTLNVRGSSSGEVVGVATAATSIEAPTAETIAAPLEETAPASTAPMADPASPASSAGATASPVTTAPATGG